MEDPTTPDRDAARDMGRRREQRDQLRSRHSHALSSLMAQRDDLRGVHDLADLVDDALRWSA